MALPFGVSWLCSALFWGCICFPPQKGYNIAHGYSLNDVGYSSHAGVLDPQTSNQFHSGSSLNPNPDFVSPGDEMQAMSHPQREPVHHDNSEDVTSLGEEMVESEANSEHEPDEFSVVPSTRSVQKYGQESSAYQHPFGLLVKEHKQEKTMEGISFPTITDFKQFIETMKSSFLTPGRDVSSHFKTARETMENQITSKAPNTEGEPAGEETARVDVNENEVWSEPMNTVSEQGANDQMPSENLHAPDPVDSTPSLISTSVYDNQYPGSALYPHPHLAATEHVKSNYGSFDSSGLFGENPDIFSNAPNVRNEDVQSTRYALPEQIASGSFFGGDFSHPSPQDFSYDPSKISNITPEKNIQQPQHTSHGKDSSSGYQKPSGGFDAGEDFQSEELSRVLSAPKPQSLNSYGKSLYVNTPRGQLYIRDYVPKHRERPAPSFQAYQPTVDKESKNIKTPTVHQPALSGSVGVQTSSPHDAQNQLVFTVKPPSSLHGSGGHDDYLGDQSVGVTRPSILTAQANDEEKSAPSEQNLVTAFQEPKQVTDNTLMPISGGLDSTQIGISSQVGDASFNSLTNLAPASERAFSRFVGMSRNFGIKNMISDRFLAGGLRGTRNPLGSFSAPQIRGMSLNGDYVGAIRADLLQTFMQPTIVRKRPANVNKDPLAVVYRPPKPLSASNVPDPTLSGVFWRYGGNTKRLPPQTDPYMSPPVSTYVVKSRSSYVRGKVSLSKTRYSPNRLDEGKTGKHQWKPSPSKYKNTLEPSVTGSEEQ